MSFLKKAMLLLLCGFAFYAVLSAELAEGGRKYALLIGINEYDGSKFPQLKGCRNDVQLVYDLLTQERFGFAPGNITVLLDGQATRTGILGAIKAVAEKVRQDDIVYIHYSGHGSTTSDSDRLKPTLVSYGARSGFTGNPGDDYDVLSDELKKEIAKIWTKTTNVIFVADSCHSGTITRGGASATRGVPADTRPHPAGAETLLDNITSGRIPWVSIGACNITEFAVEYCSGDADRMNGAFTWFWVQALQSGAGDETWATVAGRAKILMSNAGIRQTPLREGEIRRKVFGGLVGEIPKNFTVTRVSPEVRVNAGTFAGIFEKSEFQLEKKGRLTNTKLIVKKVEAFSCEVNVKDGAAEVGDVVVLTKWQPSFQPLKVALEVYFPSDRPLLSSLKNLFSADALAAYELVDAPEKSDMVLWVTRPVTDTGNSIIFPKSMETANPQIWVMDPSQNHLYNGLKNLKIPYDEKGLEVLVQNLEKLARLHGLYNMPLPEGGREEALIIEYKLFVPVTEKEWNALPSDKRLKLTNETPPYWKLNRIVSSRNPGFNRLGEERLLSVRVENKTSHSYHIYAINATLDAEIIAFLPGLDKRNTEVRPGQTSNFTDHLFLTDEDEYVRVFATLQPIDIYILEQKAVAAYREAIRSGVAVRSENHPIEAMLRELLYPTRGRPAFSGFPPAELTSMGTRFTR